MNDQELDKACEVLTGKLLSEWGGAGLLADKLGTHYNNIDRLKTGKKPNAWLIKYIKLRAKVDRFYRDIND